MACDSVKCTVLHFEQRDVTLAGGQSFRKTLLSAIKAGAARLVLDFRNIRYLFSGVLNALVETRVSARAMGGAVVLVVDNEELRQFLSTIGFDELFEIVEEAEATVPSP